MKNGVPWDIAFDLCEGGPENETLALACHVAFGEFEGGKFDWDGLRWEDRNG